MPPLPSSTCPAAMTLTSGVLLFGPPGTGKTHIARAQATSSECAFFNIMVRHLAARCHCPLSLSRLMGPPPALLRPPLTLCSPRH